MDTIYYNAQDDEFWKDINDYEGLYMVSNLGRVKSLNYRNTGKEGFLKPSPDKWGYLQVRLCKDGKPKTCLVHQLIMRAFIGECPEGCEVDHFDWNPSNNRLSNLRYQPKEVNRARHSPEGLQNISEAAKKLHQDQQYQKNHAEGCRKAFSKPVNQYALDGEYVNTWSSATDAARELELNRKSISACCNGKRKTAYGFKWQYATKI